MPDVRIRNRGYDLEKIEEPVRFESTAAAPFDIFYGT